MEGIFPPRTAELAAHHRQIFTSESQESGSKNTEWTDEKHGLYLKSMEASFVDQLYDSLDLHGSLAENCSSYPKSYRQRQFCSQIPSGQFKVLRNGSWVKYKFRRGAPQSNNVDKSHDTSVNQWIRRFRPGSRHQRVTEHSVQGKTALAIGNQLPESQPHLRQLDRLDSNTEVTDQNFADEDIEKEVENQTQSVKKMKTSAVASSSNDQVVPCREFVTTEDAGKPLKD